MESKELRKKKFEEAKRAREKAEKERKSGYGPTAEIPTFEYLVLEQNKCKVFRMVGNTVELRDKKSDPLLVEKSIIQADDGSYFTCIWNSDKDWPFRTLVRKLAKYKYDPKTKTKTYDNEGCSLLERYLTNGKAKSSAFETGMAPKKYVLVNVIDRMDSWCKDNKHTKLVAWSKTTKDDKTFYEAGMSHGLYKYIFDNKCTSLGTHYEDVDFVVRRFDQKTRPSDDTYYLVLSEDEKRAIQNWSDKDKEDYMSYIAVDQPLTDEELSYERYDLEGIPFMSQPTPIGVVMNKLGKFIKAIDEKYDWGLWEEFVAWKEKEIAEQEAKKEEQEVSKAKAPASSVEEDSSEDDLPSKVEEKKEVEAKPIKKKATKFTQDDMETFLGLSSLSDEQKAHIVSVDANDGTIKFDIDADAECGTCGNPMPDSFDVCPYCGQKY